MITLTFSQALIAVLVLTIDGALWSYLLCEHRRIGLRNTLRSAEADLDHVQRELEASYRVLERERAEHAERLAS